MTETEDRLSTAEVCEVLGVRRQTVYAYVSRGLLRSERLHAGRGSTFARTEVQRLVERQTGRAAPRRASDSWQGPVVDTDITLIQDGRLWFRGVDAVELAHSTRFEDAAAWLWSGSKGSVPFVAPPAALRTARAAVRALPPSADVMAGLRVAVAAAAAADPLRYDVRPQAVLPMAAGLIATMVQTLPQRAATSATDDDTEPGSLAEHLLTRLSRSPSSAGLLRCVDAALVLLMDHDLAVSTVAARTAASTRAHPYAVVATGLSAMEGPLHGAASTLAHRLLRDTLRDGAEQVVSDHLRAGQPLPGFGHPLYPNGDPRGRAVLELLRGRRPARVVLAAVDALTEASGLAPTVDLALAALAVATDMPREGGEVVFAVARSVGWVAHALEEYDEAPLRFRGQGRYRGPQPPRPLPDPAGRPAGGRAGRLSRP